MKKNPRCNKDSVKDSTEGVGEAFSTHSEKSTPTLGQVQRLLECASIWQLFFPKETVVVWFDQPTK